MLALGNDNRKQSAACVFCAGEQLTSLVLLVISSPPLPLCRSNPLPRSRAHTPSAVRCGSVGHWSTGTVIAALQLPLEFGDSLLNLLALGFVTDESHLQCGRVECVGHELQQIITSAACFGIPRYSG